MLEVCQLFDLNDREMKLICLYHNGREAVVDFLAYLQANETMPLELNEQIQKLKVTMLATCPRYFKMYPTELERIHTDLETLKSLLPTNDQEVFNSMEHLLTLAIFINDATEKKYVSYNGEKTTWYNCYPSMWGDNWDDYASHIVNILSYLRVNNYFDERKFYQKRIEVEIVLCEEVKTGLYKKYYDCLNHHYESSKYQHIIERYSRKYESKIKFSVQFQWNIVNAKSKPTKLYWLGSKKLTNRDCHLHSDMTKKIMHCAKNVFYDKLGEFNYDRYLLTLCQIDRENIKISGRKEQKYSCYDCVLKSSYGDTVPDTYSDCMSPAGDAFWDMWQACIATAAKEIMGIEVYIGIGTWYYETEGKYIRNGIFITRHSNKIWRLNELYKLDEVLSKAQNDFNEISEHVYVSTINPYFCVQTKNLNFSFLIWCYSPALTNIIKELIPYAQEIILNIQPY